VPKSYPYDFGIRAHYAVVLVFRYEKEKEMADMVELTEADFDKVVLKSSRPVLVFFWAADSNPSKLQAPIVDQLATTYGDKVLFAKMNLKDGAAFAAKYGASRVPVVLIFKGGSVIRLYQGLLSSVQMQDALDEALKGA
jgi:thioredoxin 1